MPRLQCGRRFPTPVGRARVGKHRRAEDEYVRPPLRLELVSAAAFAAAKRRGNDGDFDSVDEFVTGVRASEYFRKAFRGRRPGPVWFELVPEPENRYDGCAVAVDLEGERVGYVAASMAAHLHWRVRQLNRDGLACFVPGWQDLDEVWMALPTFQALDRRVDAERALAEVEAVWTDLPSEVRARVQENSFHIRERDVWAHWCARRHLAPCAGIPARPDPDQVPPLVNWFLMDCRREVMAERARVRAVEREAARAAKKGEIAARRRAKEQKKADRDQRIGVALRGGGSVTGTARALGVSEHLVRRVRDELGLTPMTQTGGPAQGQQQRVARAQRALTLFGEGMSRADIGRELGIGVDSVKDLLSLARFLAEPERFAGRLEYARRAHEQRWTNGQVPTSGARRAVTDARALALTQPAALVPPSSGQASV